MTTDTGYSPQKQAYINIAKALAPFPGRKGKDLTIKVSTSDRRDGEHTLLGFARLDRGICRLMTDPKWSSSFPNQERVGSESEFVNLYNDILESVAQAAGTKKETEGQTIVITLQSEDGEPIRVFTLTK